MTVIFYLLVCMSQYTPIQKAKNPDHIYYDLTIRNFQSTTREIQHLRFNESRSIPYVPNASEYVLSIVRFTLDTFSLPTFTADIEPNQGDPDLMIQSVTLEYDDGVNPPVWFRQILRWVPSISIPTPAAPNTTPTGYQVNSAYYNAYSYQHVINICNTALSNAMTGLIALAPALAGVPAPFLAWSPESNTASLYCRAAEFSNLASPRVNVYFDRAMYSLFNSFPTFRNSLTETGGRIYRVLVSPAGGTNVITNQQIFSNAPTIVIKQEYSTISVWQPVLQIVFTSNTLPIYPNQLSAPTILENGQIQNFSDSNANFANIITDLSSFDQSMKPTLIYVPSAEYRRIDLQAVNQPLTNLDISVYYRDKNGRLNEFLFGSGASCSIKLLFEKKHLLKKTE